MSAGGPKATPADGIHGAAFIDAGAPGR